MYKSVVLTDGFVSDQWSSAKYGGEAGNDCFHFRVGTSSDADAIVALLCVNRKRNSSKAQATRKAVTAVVEEVFRIEAERSAEEVMGCPF